jgi:uncharacterized protein
MRLPSFRYHPDPIATGSFVESDSECVCCGERRGYVYSGPVHATEELTDSLCPWCIANGDAHSRFDAEFVDAAAVGDHGSWEQVSRDVVEEVAYRTPGFTGWQQERWWTHCGDAAQFLGPAGASEVLSHGSRTLEFLRVDLGWEGEQFDEYVRTLDANGEPTAYLFRCRHCGAVGGYSDFT